ncbi:MAG: peptidylprolyl isomerase [Bacteroidota bacterium]
MMRSLVVFLVLTVSITCFGQKSKNTAQPLPLFTVGNNPVSTDEFIYLYKKNHPSKTEDYTDPKITEYLDLYINFKLKIAEAKQRKMDTTAAFKKEYNSYKEELKKPYVAESNELDRLTKEAYANLTEEVKVSHILITLKPEATPADTLVAFQKITDIRSQAIAGEDFGKLAKEFSEDPSAKSNNGNLGYFTAMQMVYPFEVIAYKTKVGEVSPPVRTRFGYHIIKVYDRKAARGEVEVSHILLRTGGGHDTKVKNTVFEIFDQLKGGRNWEELCAEYSEDNATKSNGGKLRPFGVGALSSVPEFEKVAFSLENPGDISDPFQSAIGWHLVRLEKKIPLLSFKEMEPALKRRVSRDERLQISKTSLMAKRKNELGFVEYDAAQQIKSLADTSLVKARWKFSGEESFKSQTLFVIESNPVHVGDFIQFIYKNQVNSALSHETYIHQLYEKFVEEKLNKREEEILVTQNPEFRSLLNEYYEGILLFSIMEKEVWNKASEDSSGQHGFYNQHLLKYSAGDRVVARIFSTTDQAFLEEILLKISIGDSITKEDAKKFKSVQNSRPYEKGENKIIDKISWSIGIHLSEEDGIHYLVEISKLVPPGTKSFSEARTQIISDYQDYLEIKWIAELKSKYPVKVNTKSKKNMLAELKNKNILTLAK